MQDSTIHNVPSLISREASTAIKGLLMLLIVFGHSGLLTTNFDTGELTFFHDWLYTFHVHVYMILPFIYGYKRNMINTDNEVVKIVVSEEVGGGKLVDFQNIINDLKHNVIKIGVPYFWFFVFYAFIFVAFGGGGFNLGGLIYAFIFGGQNLMAKYVGFNMLWFLPAILALTTLKSIWYNSQSVVKYTILSISIILWVLCITRLLEMSETDKYSPFSIVQGLYYLLIGMVARLLTVKYSSKRMILWVIAGIVFLSVVFYIRNEMAFNPFWIIRMVMPILIFLLLYSISDYLSKSKFLFLVGTYSLQIYLIHVAVIKILETILLHFTSASIGLGWIIYILTLVISILLALFMVNIRIIRKVVFPNG